MIKIMTWILQTFSPPHNDELYYGTFTPARRTFWKRNKKGNWDLKVIDNLPVGVEL